MNYSKNNNISENPSNDLDSSDTINSSYAPQNKHSINKAQDFLECDSSLNNSLDSEDMDSYDSDEIEASEDFQENESDYYALQSDFADDFDDNFDDNFKEENNLFSYKEEKKKKVQEELKNSSPTKGAKEKSNSELEAWEIFEKGDKAWNDFNHRERENIVKHYAPKIRFIALRMKAKLPKHIDLNELISSGTIGLLEALGKFKPQLAIRFDSYAESRIRGAMIDELRKLDWFPRSLRARVREIDNAIWKLENENGKQPNTEEIAKFTGLTEKEVDLGLEALQHQLCVSLDAVQDTLSSEGGAHNEENPFQNTVLLEMVDKVAGLIDTLTPREKLVLSLYYNDELNMREASEVMEITEGRVSQLHAQAISRLRKIFTEKYEDSL